MVGNIIVVFMIYFFILSNKGVYMGYGIMQIDAKFSIKAINKEKALIILKKNIKSKNKTTAINRENSFSFVNEDYKSIDIVSKRFHCESLAVDRANDLEKFIKESQYIR